MAQPMARPARGGAEVTSHPHGACLVLHFDMCDACRVRELEADMKENEQLYRVGLRAEKDCIEELKAELVQAREWAEAEKDDRVGAQESVLGAEARAQEQFNRCEVLEARLSAATAALAEAEEQGGLGPSPLGDEPPSDVVRSPAPDQLERLAEASHNGWRAARIAQGWADHPPSGPYAHLPMGVLCSTCHGDPKMHHPSMVPYSDLPEADKEASRGPVRAALEAFPP